MKKYLFMAAAMLSLAACQEEPKTPETPEATDEISLAPESKTFTQDGGEQPVMVTSSGEWTLEAKETYDWIRPNVEKGQDGDVVNFSADPNYTGQTKTAVYVFTCGKETAEFTATSQSGEPCTLELVSEASLELKYTGTSIEIMVNTNANIKHLTHDVNAGWCTFTAPIETETGAKLAFTLSANDGRDARTAEIIIGVDKDKEPGADNVEPVKVTVIQRAHPVITVDANVYSILPEGGNVEMTVDANVEYDITVKATEGSEWLTHVEKREGKEIFSAPAFEGTRESTVTFTEKNPLEGETPVIVSAIVKQARPALLSKVIDMTNSRMYMSSGLGRLETFTIEMLVKAEDLSKGISHLFGWNTYFICLFGGSNSEISSDQLNIYGAQIQVVEDGKGGFKNANWDYPYISDPADCKITDKEWHHIAITVEKKRIHAFSEYLTKLYIDGTVRHSGGIAHHANLSIGAPFFNTKFYFGSESLANGFKGSMAEIRVWNKALSESELQAENHFYTIDPESEGLLAYWKFDYVQNNGYGYEVPDATGSDNVLWFEGYDSASGEFSGNIEPQLVDVSLP